MPQHIFQHHANRIYEKSVKYQTVHLLINEKKDLWTQIVSNELVRLSQVNDAGVKANGCVNFIHHQDVPNNRKVTYTNFLCDPGPLKSDHYRISLLLRGEKLDYNFDAGSPAVSMLETKILFNIVILDAK